MTRACRPLFLRRALRLLAFGAVLGGATLALAQGKVFVSSEKDNKLYVFDAKGEKCALSEIPEESPNCYRKAD